MRFHSLDALRAAMMLLGLVLHSAASYTRTPLGDAWPYHDGQTNVVFDLLVFFIHLFRMPAFFVMAGFFAALLYSRGGRAGFARNRVRRVLLPLLIFWPLVVPLGAVGFLFSMWRAGRDLPPLVPLTGLPWWRLPVLGHLWFLYDLLIFYGAAVALVRLADRWPAPARGRASGLFHRIGATPPGALLMASITLVTLLPMEAAGLDTSAALLPPFRELIAYGVFFAFGWLLYGHRDQLHRFGASWRLTTAGGIGAAVVYLLIAVEQPFTDRTAFHLSAVTAASLSIWLLIYGFIGLFLRYLNAGRPSVRYFSDASYWMYLVHILPATWVPGLLAPSSLPAVVKFTIVLGVTMLLSAGSYHLFVRSTAVGQLLNGRRYERSRSVHAIAHP